VMRIPLRNGIGTLIQTAPEAWRALATAGKAKGAPRRPATTSTSGASSTVRPSSSTRIVPVRRASPARGRVVQIESTSPGPVCSAITQRPAAARRQAERPWSAFAPRRS
jgi:hypothetical protein